MPKKYNMKINRIGYLLMLVMFFSACTKLEYNQQFSSTFPISGDWTIKVNDGTTTTGPFFIKIYNTSFSKDSVWIDDNGTFWTIKAKAKVDMKNLTFSAVNAENEYYTSQVNFANGKVIGKDSIYFEAVFSDELATDGQTPAPYATTFKFSGHRKVSYEEYMGL